jgi:hypothetical protein
MNGARCAFVLPCYSGKSIATVATNQGMIMEQPGEFTDDDMAIAHEEGK